ncbi:uncharacterized protein LOC114575463 [Exaiptasia diaphana]|uniref:Uncharacterized protein n=1 Tax=Exaiptasia diaphana TaxID=2652724 RepID=A0A913YM98_EXADI|nr:uncharacterized protein LOC114575463 [Exaiptasia diaphana]
METFSVTSGNLPPWKVSVVRKSPYIPGLRPESLPPNKQFTVQLHCILDALSSPEPQSPRRPKSSRAMSVSPRLYTPRKQYTPTPRPSTAPSLRPKTAIGLRTPEMTRKSLTPTRMKEDIKSAIKSLPSKPKAGSDKPIAIKPRPRPKAGSITPVAIRRPPKIPQVLLDYDEDDKRSIDSNENIEAKHGYYVYVDGLKVYTNQPPSSDGKPTASVKPMLASDFIDSNENKADVIEDFEKDLKPVITTSFESGESIEASQ